ncbi:MAG: hypothetical protein ACKO6L_09870 [Flavobacteriales bacterium]
MITIRPYPVWQRQHLKWFIGLVVVKVFWFTFFIAFRADDWHPLFQVNGIAIRGGDSFTYYGAMESFIQDGQYGGACRMPGLLPVYLPLRWILSENAAMVAMVFFQLVMDIITTWLLGVAAARIFGGTRTFYITLTLAALSTFVAIRSNYLLSDSLCVSAFILSVYFLTSHLTVPSHRSLWLSGLFFVWSIFLRPIMIVAIPVVLLIILLHQRNVRRAMVSGCVWMLPVILVLGLWFARNKMTYGRNILLVAPLKECMFRSDEVSSAVRTLIIAMGEDFQPWTEGGAAEWFFNPKANAQAPSPVSNAAFCSEFSSDSLVQLRQDFRAYLLNDSLPEHDAVGEDVMQRCMTYKERYRTHHPFRFYIWNRILFMKMLLFPSRVDDLPLPARNAMNALQFGSKAWSLLLLWLVSAISLLSVLIFMLCKRWDLLIWSGLAFAFVVVLSIHGYIEQRYLATAYPFMICCIAWAIGLVMEYRSTKLSSHSTTSLSNEN